MNVTWVVIRLRMVAVHFRDAVRRQIRFEKPQTIDDGEANVCQAALIAARVA